jgi:hypothetical protein
MLFAGFRVLSSASTETVRAFACRPLDMLPSPTVFVTVNVSNAVAKSLALEERRRHALMERMETPVIAAFKRSDRPRCGFGSRVAGQKLEQD